MKDYHEKFVDARDYNASIQFWSEWRVDDGEVLINSRYENAVIFDEVFTSGDPVGNPKEVLYDQNRSHNAGL
jgi:hypothetical protein